MTTGNIVSFPSLTQAIQRFRHIEAEEMMKITQEQIARILSFEGGESDIVQRDQLRQQLEQSMLHALMQANYQINYDTIRAIEYIARMIGETIRQEEGVFVTPIGDEVETLRLPYSDKLFLNFIYSLHREDVRFQEQCYENIGVLYSTRAESIITPDASVTEDLRYLFIEIGWIVELISKSITTVLEPYSPYQLTDTRVIPFRRRHS